LEVDGKSKPVASSQTAICIIYETIEPAGFASPLHQPSTTNYHAENCTLIEAYYWHNDPTMIQKQDAGSVMTPNHIYLSSRTTSNCHQNVIRELTLIAFLMSRQIYVSHPKNSVHPAILIIRSQICHRQPRETPDATEGQC